MGSSGFIGQYLYKKLKSKNIIFKSHAKNKRCINLNNSTKIKIYLKKNRINLIVNLINSPDYEKIIAINKNLNNVLNGLNVKVLLVSSSLVYGNKIKSANEKSKLKPFNSYTKLKVKLEKMIKITNLNYKIIRLSNVYDNNLDKKGLFKNIKDCLQKKTHYISFNNTNIYRNFIHIYDVCNLFEKIVTEYEKINKNVINIGAENIKLGRIIDMYRKKFNIKILVRLNKNKKYDPSIKIDNKFIKNKLNFKRTISLKKTINKLEL